MRENCESCIVKQYSFHLQNNKSSLRLRNGKMDKQVWVKKQRLTRWSCVEGCLFIPLCLWYTIKNTSSSLFYDMLSHIA